MDCMKVSAASLSNDTVCHFSSHIRFKSVFLSESMTVEFEQEKFYFEYKEKWYITHQSKTYALVVNDVLELCIHDFSTVSIQLMEWESKWHQTAAIPFDQKVLIGSGIGCDGIVDGRFPVKLIEFVKRGSQVNYMVYSGRKCAVNGKLSALKGTINAPSLIQVDQLSVFLGDKAVVFNCAAVISDDVLQMSEPDLFIAERNIPRYFHSDQISALTLKEPEFLSLPAVRGISIFTMGPMLTMSAASLLSAYFSYMNSGNQNVLVMPVMMLFSSLFWPLTNVLFDAFKLYQLKKRRRKQYIKECSDLMELVSKTKIQVQQSIVSPEQLKPHEVWQIRQGHPQFLKVPIGKGKMLSGWTLKSASKCPDVSETECLDQRARLIEKMKFIEDVIKSYKVDEVRGIFYIRRRDTFYYFICYFL